MIRQRIAIFDEQNFHPLSRQERSLLRQALRYTIRMEKPKDFVELTLSFVDLEEMLQLNQEYRGIPAPTDVLSFVFEDLAGESGFLHYADLTHRPLGDIVIAMPAAIQQAYTYGHSVQREIVFLAVHGTLHLLGYDHGDTEDDEGLNRMIELQEKVLNAVGLPRTGI